MEYKERSPALFLACRSGKDFAEKLIIEYSKLTAVNKELGKMQVENFSDGEIHIIIDEETVRGKDVYIIQNLYNPLTNINLHENLFELLSVTRAIKSYQAYQVTIVVPYLAYSRQDYVAEKKQPINAKMVMDMLNAAGADGILTMHIHSKQQQGFVPNVTFAYDNLMPTKLFVNHINKNYPEILSNSTVFSLDVGGIKLARELKDKLNLRLVISDKKRPKAEQIDHEEVYFVGEEEDIIGKIGSGIDDMVSSAGTLYAILKKAKSKGLKEFIMLATHSLLVSKAIERLTELYDEGILKKLIVTNTIPQKDLPFIEIIEVNKDFAEAIYRKNTNRSVSLLYS